MVLGLNSGRQKISPKGDEKKRGSGGSIKIDSGKSATQVRVVKVSQTTNRTYSSDSRCCRARKFALLRRQELSQSILRRRWRRTALVVDASGRPTCDTQGALLECAHAGAIVFCVNMNYTTAPPDERAVFVDFTSNPTGTYPAHLSTFVSIFYDYKSTQVSTIHCRTLHNKNLCRSSSSWEYFCFCPALL